MLMNLFQIIYPSFCSSCKKIIDQNSILCFSCQSRLKPVVPIILPITKRYTINIYTACAYMAPVKNLILKKFSYDKLACYQLANIMLSFIPFNSINPDFLIPVPLHWTRFSWRGYNQSEVIAKTIEKQLNIPILKLITRKQRTVFQSKLNPIQRDKNTENAFKIKNKYVSQNQIKDKNILIIDDLFTTGATIKSVAKIITTLNPKSISAAIACRKI